MFHHIRLLHILDLFRFPQQARREIGNAINVFIDTIWNVLSFLHEHVFAYLKLLPVNDPEPLTVVKEAFRREKLLMTMWGLEAFHWAAM